MYMNSFTKIKNFVLWTAILAFTYLVCCPLTFDSKIFIIIIDHLPFVALAVVDICLLYRLKLQAFAIGRHYLKKNKLLIIACVFYSIYDLITVLWACDPQYSVWKYILFVKTIFLLLSMCLCIYDIEHDKFRKNIEALLKNMGYILILAVLTTIIRYVNNSTPYLFSISLNNDYNVYGSYILFLLLLFTFYFIHSFELFSYVKKIVFIVFIILGVGVLMLSGSRRVIVVLPLLITFAVITAMIEIIKPLFRDTEKKQWKRIWQRCVVLVVIIAVIFLDIQNITPAFQKYANFKYESQVERLADTNIEQIPEKINPEEETTDGQEPLRGQYETYLASRYDNINGGLSERKMIWNIAIHRIKEFDIVELAIGKGNGYGWSLYEDTKNEQVKELVEYFGVEVSPQWMTPHNLFLREMLDGGLIKILLLLFIGMTLLLYLLKYMRKDYVYGIMLLCMYISIGASFILGSTYGLLGEDLFWLVTGILVLLRTSAEDKNESLG